MNVLHVFTSSYPYGKGEPWLSDELPYLQEKFDEINIYPLYFGQSKDLRTLPVDNVKVHIPALPESYRGIIIKIFIQSICCAESMKIIYHELFKEKAIYNLHRIKTLVLAVGIGRYLKKNVQFFNKNSPVDDNENEHTLYFYWGKGYIYILPFININKFKAVFSRFHGGDLYKYVNFGYLPFRKQIMEKINKAVFISENGLDYAKKEYGKYIDKYVVHRLGVKPCKNLAQPSNDGIFRIVTCSFMVPVKRIHILIEALNQIKEKIQWTHIGSGILQEELSNQAKTLPENVQFKFTGFLSNEKVKQYYEQNPVDLFINVSESEGVPVSIMEALSAGIPVMATDVGGTSEIVDEKVGILLPSKINKKELSGLIIKFIYSTEEDKISMKNNALQRFKEKCDICTVYDDFSALLGRVQ